MRFAPLSVSLLAAFVIFGVIVPAASFGPAFGGFPASASTPRHRGGRIAAPVVGAKFRNALAGRSVDQAASRGLRLSMSSEPEIDNSDLSSLPTGLKEEFDAAVRLNDLLLVQDFVKSDLLDPSLALHRASCADCSNEMLDMLLDTGAEINWADESGRSSLMCAVTRKSLSMAAALVSKGADVEFGGSSYSGRTPLMQAASSGSMQIVQLLLDAGADANAEDRFGRSVVVQAAMMGKKEVVRRIEKFMKDSGRNSGRRSNTRELLTGGTAEDGEGGDVLLEVDPDVNNKLWSSLISEALPVDGRDDLFQWKGRLLRQPEPLADGGLVIVDAGSGEVVYKGFPPAPAGEVPPGGANDVEQPGGRGGSLEPSAAINPKGYSVVRTAARLAISPAVAMTRVGSQSLRLLKGTLARQGSPSRALSRDEPAGVSEAERSSREAGATPRYKSFAEHQDQVQKIAREIAGRRSDQLITLQRGGGDSHCPRSTSYKESTLQVDVSALDGILGVEQVSEGVWQALVEPRVTMEKLVRAVLPLGLVPQVVPEFRRITVGGSVQGIAGESSSFEKGFFHDSCDSYEVVLGDGSVILATANNEYADIFDALPGTYGTLAVLTAASVRLMPAKPYVGLEYLPFKKLGTMMNHISSALDGQDVNLNTVDFLEGFGYGPNQYVVAQGRFCGEDEALSGAAGKIQKYDKAWSPWFYKRALQRAGSFDVVPTEDYLFRHDRGSFWMASYKMPHFVGRALGFLLPSHKMYKMANLLPAVFDKNEILLQDFMIPVGQVQSFVETLDSSLGVWPLWFCPLKNVKRKGLIFGVPTNAGHFCNVGAYGIPSRVKFDFERDNKMMEQVMLEHGGRKVHYSHAYYPQELFYGHIYDGEYYAELRGKYRAEDAFPHVHEKVVTKPGEL